MPELSIAIVTKGRPEALINTLERFKELDIRDSVMIVDGSNSNETEKLCDEFGVRYIQQTQEGGRCAARNEALEKCTKDYIAYLDDDVLVSEEWFQEIEETFKRKSIVGVTGKLEGEDIAFSGITEKMREFLFGGREVFGEILDNGVINGDFFYDEEKEVDHLVGCNMAFDVEALREVGGFNKDYNVGNAYREETEPSYLVGRKGKLMYNPEASVNHREVEDIEPRTEHFYRVYMTKYFLSQNNIVKGVKGRSGYILNKIARHTYFGLRSLVDLNSYYLYYFYGEIQSFIDFILLDRKPREHV